jgi:mRNA interferase RelE/StbE
VPRYAIRFARSARKELERLDSELVERVFARIASLAIDPRPPGCRKLKGNSYLWRIRVGDYRVLYEILDPAATIDIIVVRHRREAYD